MRLLVTGGRDYTDKWFVFQTLDLIHAKRPITLLIEGGQTGADRLARMWAISRGIPFETVDADWKRYGHAAGPIRNKAMLNDWTPDGVVAFPGDRGTANMRRQAKKAGVIVWDVRAWASHFS